jgi:hypothetical protein
MFFVSVASKELRPAVSGLESTLAGCLISVDSKIVRAGVDVSLPSVKQKRTVHGAITRPVKLP